MAVKLIDPNRSFLEAVEASNFLRKNIADLGLNVLGDLSDSAPAVTTIQLPKVLNSIKIGNKLKHYGFELSFNSEYLVKRNFIQICLMGNWSKSGLKKFPATLKKVSSDKIN